MSDELNTFLFVELVGKMVQDQFEVLSNIQLEHDRRVRAFLMITMAVSMIPEEAAMRDLSTHIQQLISSLPPLDMVNTIHVCADAMSTMLSMGMAPPPGTFGGLS